MTKGYCSRCGRRHSSRSSSRTRSSSPMSISHMPENLVGVLNSTHTSLLGLDPNFLKNPRYQGEVYNVGIARNYTGTDSGDVAVLKWVRGSHHCRHGDHLSRTLRTVAAAAQVIHAFLENTNAKGWRILLNYPRLVVCEGDKKFGGKKALVEPYISRFTKFNSNSGWINPEHSHRTYHKMLQALSHFSYVFSRGQFLLCDLQGGVREDERVVYLSDPAIVTDEGGLFGCSDTGRKGIRNFFHYHECNKYCEHQPTPKDRKLFFRAVESTITTG